MQENYDVELLTDQGQTRGVGFEIEYAGVPLWRAARIVQGLFGGNVEERSKAEWYVVETSLGSFRLEIDAEPVKKLVSGIDRGSDATADGFERLLRKTADAAGDVVASISEKIAPLEIIAPPVPIEKIEELDKLREALFYENAKDTQASLHHAFGLHINPDAISLKSENILKHIQAFALLYPMLKNEHNVDFSRRITLFIEPYSTEYLNHIMADGYAPTQEQLICDYHRFNKSRNKALDMLPLFSELDKELVRELYGADEKINARPTYHYRLPNCEVSNGDWSLMKEWQRWLLIERLASNDEELSRLRDEWREQPTVFTERMRVAGTPKADKLASAGGA
ncbi:amidoligase family protein [Kordiimonas aestuarii]|uniref:amidoligase family protein n=1 Tax=Kordiimonas aestuarii TaxID=1005925 RepID=UPI0021CE99D9|nr:amidoligase family protein [Kordiimonas aestuarii]